MYNLTFTRRIPLNFIFKLNYTLLLILKFTRLRLRIIDCANDQQAIRSGLVSKNIGQIIVEYGIIVENEIIVEYGIICFAKWLI